MLAGELEVRLVFAEVVPYEKSLADPPPSVKRQQLRILGASKFLEGPFLSDPSHDLVFHVIVVELVKGAYSAETIEKLYIWPKDT